MDTIAVTGRHDLSDTQWAVLEALLPKAKKTGRSSRWTKRQLIDGIRWRVRVGAPWRDVPDRYGSWAAVDGVFRRWQRDGTWARLLTALQALADAAGRIVWDVSVDSTIARAHQHAAGRVKGGSTGRTAWWSREEPADHALGRSRGGLTTKIHLGCEQGQKPLSIVLTAGQRGDSPQFTMVLEGIRCPAWVRAGPGPARTGSWPTATLLIAHDDGGPGPLVFAPTSGKQASAGERLAVPAERTVVAIRNAMKALVE